jgi:ribosomal protein S18 acetylase RimI-like enzyme
LTATNTKDFVIHHADASDVPAVYRLLTELAESTGLTTKFLSSEDDLRRHGFGKDPLFEAILARHDGTAIGLSLFFLTYSSWRGAPGVYVQDLVVSRGAQTKGVGRELLCATARFAAARGATHLRLSVEHDNEQAIGFYKAAGLRQSCNERIFEADNEGFEGLVRHT